MIEYIKFKNNSLGCNISLALTTDIYDEDGNMNYDVMKMTYDTIWNVIKILEPSDWNITSKNMMDKYQRHELKCTLIWSKDEALKRLKSIGIE